MNFIKKKLKGHKKDDEEEEYEKAVYEQSLHPKTDDQKMKNTEEWQFFQQLSMKVQDTVQKTQTTLNKLKDIRQDSLQDDKDSYDIDDELLSKENSTAEKVPPYGTTRVLRAPPRPPPPSGDKPNFAADTEFISDFSHGSPAKGPPRPPPPDYEKSDLSFNLDSSALHGTPSKSFNSPARPPPPNYGRQDNAHVGENFSVLSDSSLLESNPTDKACSSFSLLDEFGFNNDVSTSSNLQTNFQDLLFLDDKEDIDPFDTSFVDVSNISSQSSVLNKETNGTGSKANENSFNPFSSSAPSDDWVTSSVNISSAASKAATNPFFTGIVTESKSDEKEYQSWSAHNPFGGDSKNIPLTNAENDDFFSASQNVTVNNAEKDDFFGISQNISVNNSKKDDFFGASHNNSANNTQKEDFFGLSKNTPANNTENDDFFGINLLSSPINDIGDTFQKNEQSFVASIKQASNNDLLNTDFIMDKPLELDELNTEVTLTQEMTNTLNINKESSDVNCLNDVWMSDVKEENNLFSNEIISNAEVKEEDGLPETSIVWDTYTPKSEILMPEKVDIMDEQSHSEQIDEKIITDYDKTDFFNNDEISQNKQEVEMESTPVFSPSETSVEEKNFESVLHKESSNNDFTFSKEVNSMEFKSNTLESFERKSSIPQPAEVVSNNFEMTENKELNTQKSEEPQNVNDTFSKPFEEENENNTFLFKVKATEENLNLDFDAFAAKFESAKDSQENEAFDPFMSKRAPNLKKIKNEGKGFGSMDEFDPFKVTRNDIESKKVLIKDISRDSFEDYDNEMDFSVVIKPKVKDINEVKPLTMEPPKLLPPPKTPTKAFETTTPRFNPFDKDFVDPTTQPPKPLEKTLEFAEVEDDHPVPALGEAGVRKADSIDTPMSPLFDEDTSQPLEVFPQPYGRDGWEMVLRQPNKKKLTGNRFWKKIFVKLSDNSVLQLFNKEDDKLPFQELPLQACYSLSEIGAQQYDQYGKIFTVKLQYKFYRERVGVRPGQISKVTQGQVTSMGDVAKLGLPLQHSPQTSQLLKIGSQFYKDIKIFIQELEDALFRMVVHRDRVLTYKTEEIQVIAQDEFYVEQSKTGHIDKQLARVRIFFLAFITGMPSVEVGLNDINRQGKEVVGRYDIMPVVTEEWIRLEDCEFHSCVIQDEFQKNRVIKFHPPDACLFELLRFRIRPPKNRELPLQVRVFMTVSSTRVEIRSDILVPGYSSRKQGQIPCENIQIRFPVPECWIYLFRTEKHFRYGSKKSTARRPGKIKGLERIIGAAQNLDPSLIEVSAGQAKYEHVFHAVVWRIPRLPKEGQGAYTQQLFLLRTELTSFDQIPESFERYVDVEFTMPATYVSHTTVRSVSVTNPIPPEKYVRYISKHEYKVEIEFKSSSDEIDGLMASPNVSIPVSTTPAVQESTEDEEKDDSD